MDFRTLKSLTIPEGVVTKITNAAGSVLWQKKNEALPNYVKFSSNKPFTITIGSSGGKHDGTLYWTDNPNDWSGCAGGTKNNKISLTAPENGTEYAFYMRGSGNTVLSADSSSSVCPWELTAESDVYCFGNLESLLDYETVEAGGHPTMAAYCCSGMFKGWTNLVSAPSLPSPALANYCYQNMFAGCSNLIAAPALPATTLASNCYINMFSGCTSLIMSPALPATTLATMCYGRMFVGCASLIGLPALPATTLANNCYANMFQNCSSIKLSTTKTNDYSLEYRVPISGTGTGPLATTANMFVNTGGSFVGTPTINTTYYLDASNSIVYPDHLTFASTDTFSISVGTPGWDGKMEYSTDLYSWNTWDGSEISGTAIYLRGSGNTKVTGNSSNYKWTLTGSNISCAGNIEALLDYKTVTAGEHPTMAGYCYAFMFYNCTGLVSAPELPAATLSNYCYRQMFYGCSALATAPALPATTLTSYCYYGMFYGCTKLTTAPKLPATTLSGYCYGAMFRGCTGLTTAPELPATKLMVYCYQGMFYGCTSLTSAPELPATILADYCCQYMFQNCTSLTTAPALPSMVLATGCYHSMFYGCTKLTSLPKLPATTLYAMCYYRMFYNCSSISIFAASSSGYTKTYRIPSVGTGTTAENAMYQMFYGNGSNMSTTTTPTINTTYYTANTIINTDGTTE